MLFLFLKNDNNGDVYTLWWLKMVSALPHQSGSSPDSLPILTGEMTILFVFIYLLIFMIARWQQREDEKRDV